MTTNGVRTSKFLLPWSGFNSVVKKKQCLDFASHTKFLTVLLVLIATSFSLAKDQN